MTSQIIEFRNELKRRKIQSVSAFEIDESLIQHIRRRNAKCDKRTYQVRMYETDGGVREAGSLLNDLHRTRNIGLFRNMASSHGFGMRFFDGGLSFQITPGYAMDESLDAETVRDQLYEDYPNSEIRQLTSRVPPLEKGRYVAAADLGMFRAEYLPLKHIDIEGFSDQGGEYRDPYKNLLTKVAQDDDETVCVQVAFRPARKGFIYRRRMRRAANKMGQKKTYWTLTGAKRTRDPTDEEQSASSIIEQQNDPMYEMAVRVFAVADTPEAATSRVDAVVSTMDEYYESHVQQGLYGRPVNGRQKLDDFFGKFVQCDATDGMKVMASELQGLAHLPESHVNNPSILQSQAKSGSPVPPGAPRFDFGALGISDDAPDNVKQLVMIESANVGDPYWYGWGKRNGVEAGVYDRYLNAHQFVPGRTRMGKTVALTNFAGQAMRRWVGDEERESVIALLAETLDNADDVLSVEPELLSAGMTLSEVEEETPDLGSGEGVNPARSSNTDRQDSEGGLIIDPKGKDGDDFVAEWPDDRPEEDLIVVDLGDENECIPRFNMLEIPESVDPDTRKFDSYTSAVADVATMMVAEAGGSDNYVGSVMKRVTRTLTRGMLKSGRSCTFLDLAACASYKGDFEQFSEWMSEERHAFIGKAARRIADDDGIDLNPLAGRFDEYVQPDSIRAMISAREPTFSIQEAVDEGKWIVLIFPQYAGKTEVTALSNSYIAETYLAKMLSDNDAPYHLIGDEVHNFTTDESMLPHILSQGGGMNYRCTLACQSPANQLPKDMRNAVQDNIDIWNSFKCPGNTSSYVAAQYRDVDSEAIEDATRYSSHLVQYTEQDEDIGTLINDFPPMREVREDVLGDEARSQEEIDALKRRSMERYGEPMPTPEEQQEESPFFGDGDATTEGEERSLAEDSERTILRAVLDESIHRDDVDVFDAVPADAAEARIRDYLGADDDGIAKVWDAVDHVPRDKLARETRDGDVYLRCTEEGKSEIFSSGEAENTGGIDHRELLKDAFVPLARAGLVVNIVRQDGDDLPDARAEPEALRDVDTASLGVSEVADLFTDFQNDDPTLARLTGGDEVTIEAESKTSTKPGQTIKNLAQAVERGERCLFVAREDAARRVHNALTSPPFISKEDGDGRVFYNRRYLSIDGEQVFRPAPANNTVWRFEEDSGEYIMGDSDGNEWARFDSHDAIFEDVDAYPATEDDIEDPDEWKKVKGPVIPERVFDGDLPDPETWDVIVVPDVEEDEEADADDLELFVDDGLMVPLMSVGQADDEGDDGEDTPASDGVDLSELGDGPAALLEILRDETDGEVTISEAHDLADGTGTEADKGRRRVGDYLDDLSDAGVVEKDTSGRANRFSLTEE